MESGSPGVTVMGLQGVGVGPRGLGQSPRLGPGVVTILVRGRRRRLDGRRDGLGVVLRAAH